MSSPRPQQVFELALQHHQAGRLSEAQQLYGQLLAKNPQHADALHLMGVLAGQTGNPALALRLIGQAIALSPGVFAMHTNLGNVLKDTGKLTDAILSYGRALALQPHRPEAHYNLSLAMLLAGEWTAAWPEYQWRWKVPGAPATDRRFRQPMWDGGDLAGRVILLHAEEDLGEAIQFMRYVPGVLDRGGRVVVETHRELIRLLRQTPGVERWIIRGEALPEFDVHCPLSSLPQLFRTTPEAIPPQPPLRAEQELVWQWSERMPPRPARLRVALVWAAIPPAGNDHVRSLSLARLSALAQAPKVTFYAVQTGAPAQQAEYPPEGMELVNFGTKLRDFSDIAAILTLVDIVLTTDTAIAHLAGAMGRPAWVMLPAVPEWRWLLDRADSPWYPSIGLFRQRRPGDWEEVIGRVALALTEMRDELRK